MNYTPSDVAAARKFNHRAGWLASDYICQTPRAITKDLINSVKKDSSKESEEHAFAALLASYYGLEPDTSKEDDFIYNFYLLPGVKRLDAEQWRNNPYYKEISIPEESFGSWKLTHQHYEPYEAFICDDLAIEQNLLEIPQIGFFNEPFTFPSVLQDGREWMSIKPSEIITSQAAIDGAVGNVVTFGLGLGYFVFMALRKREVKSVTVVERDESVIRLFEKYILPQFPRKQDVKIIQSDAFEFMNGPMPFDYAFVDIWHDISDGQELYVKAKSFEKMHPEVKFTYWLERSLRCALADYLTEFNK